MRVYRVVAAGALALTVGSAGCKNFLNADKAVADPNNPTVATTNQLFVGVQASVFAQQESAVAMLVCEWMQQCGGVNGRFVDQQGTYVGINAGSFDGSFQSIYTGDGLLGIRAVEAATDAAGNKVYKGMTEVLEVMDVMFGADIWGAIPYRDAVGANPTPKFDPQFQVYADLLALADKAIADLGGSGVGPGACGAAGSCDLVYGGNAAYWIEAAHTLKARIYLHEVAAPGPAATMYANALAEAQMGISDTSHDWKTQHSTATSERNVWAQFQFSSFGNDLVAGAPLVNIMKAQNDPRLPQYFGQAPKGGYFGYDVTTGLANTDSISPIQGSARTNNVAFQQPIITYDETQLIIAESQFQLGNVAAAAGALNRVRAEWGKPAIVVPTLNDIMTEKYISLFQNIEYWNDYKRTCLPVLHPALGKPSIPGRLFYGQTEAQTNPKNIPAEPGNLFTNRNANNPAACPP